MSDPHSVGEPSQPTDSQRSDTQVRESATGQLDEKIGRKAERRIRARQDRRRGVWFGLGMFGLVGWSVAIPTVLGATIGMWLDRQFPNTTSWTLTLLVMGLILGCLTAWRWVRDESEEP